MGKTNFTSINAKTLKIGAVQVGGAPTGPVTTLDSVDAAAVLAVNGSAVQGALPAGGVYTNFGDVSVNAMSVAGVSYSGITTVRASITTRSTQGGVVTLAIPGSGAITYHCRDVPFTAWANPSLEYWQGKVTNAPATNAACETTVGNGMYVRFGLLTGGTDKALNQTSATLSSPTFVNAAACVAGYIWKLNGQTPTPTEFATACTGKTPISVDNTQIYCPDGWRVQTDPVVGLSGLANVAYYWNLELTGNSGDLYPYPYTFNLERSLADATSSVASSYSLKDWTSKALGNDQTAPGCVAGIWADCPNGTITTGIVGDSINDAQMDGLDGNNYKTGDADGVTGFVARAFNIVKQPFVRATLTGDRASIITQAITAGNQGYAQRGLALRYCQRVFSDMGHNDRASAQVLTISKAWWALLRSYALPGAKIIQTDLMPLASSTDLFVTTTNQTDTSGAYQYSLFNPYINGTLNPANGDPDKGYSMNAATYAYAISVGWTVPATPYRLWPVNGNPSGTTGSSPMYDGTHPRGPLHAGIAVDLATKWPTLVA